jgi:hypothetical protein
VTQTIQLPGKAGIPADLIESSAGKKLNKQRLMEEEVRCGVYEFCCR